MTEKAWAGRRLNPESAPRLSSPKSIQNPKSASTHRLHAGLAAGTAAALFAGLLVVRNALDVLRKPFLFARLLKPPDHLFGGFVPRALTLIMCWGSFRVSDSATSLTPADVRRCGCLPQDGRVRGVSQGNRLFPLSRHNRRGPLSYPPQPILQVKPLFSRRLGPSRTPDRHPASPASRSRRSRTVQQIRAGGPSGDGRPRRPARSGTQQPAATPAPRPIPDSRKRMTIPIPLGPYRDPGGSTRNAGPGIPENVPLSKSSVPSPPARRRGHSSSARCRPTGGRHRAWHDPKLPVCPVDSANCVREHKGRVRAGCGTLEVVRSRVASRPQHGRGKGRHERDRRENREELPPHHRASYRRTATVPHSGRRPGVRGGRSRTGNTGPPAHVYRRPNRPPRPPARGPAQTAGRQTSAGRPGFGRSNQSPCIRERTSAGRPRHARSLRRWETTAPRHRHDRDGRVSTRSGRPVCGSQIAQFGSMASTLTGASTPTASCEMWTFVVPQLPRSDAIRVRLDAAGSRVPGLA